MKRSEQKVKNYFAVLFLLSGLASVAEAGFFVGPTGSRMILDYKNVQTPTSTVDITGSLELIGVSAGYTTYSPGNFGYKATFSLLGTNSEKLSSEPGWGTPTYFRITGEYSYMFSFGLFFHTGLDLISSLYQEASNHYLGTGFTVGFGQRINDKISISLTQTNNSVLFAGTNRRVLRGQFLEVTFSF